MPDQPPVDEQNDIRKRAVRRLIAAFVVVALAIVALTILSKYEPEKPVTQTAPQETVLPPEKPVPATPPEAPPPPPEAEAQPQTPPPPPEVVNAPAPATAPEKPAVPAEEAVSAKPAPVKPAPAPKPTAETPSGLRLDHKLTAAPARPAAPVQPPVQAKPAEPLRPVERAAVPAPARPAEVAAPKGYTVQLGVFSNPANALQLQEKLAQHGIKSYTETKLNIGPFQTRAEADQALAKLRSLGISAVVVPGR